MLGDAICSWVIICCVGMCAAGKYCCWYTFVAGNLCAGEYLLGKILQRNKNLLRGLKKFAAALSCNAKKGTANRLANLFANLVLVRIPYYLDTQTLISLRVWPTVVVDGFKKTFAAGNFLLRDSIWCWKKFAAAMDGARNCMLLDVVCC